MPKNKNIFNINVWSIFPEDVGDSSSLAKWSSLDLLTEEDIEQDSSANLDKQGDRSFQFNLCLVFNICNYFMNLFFVFPDSIFSHTFLQRVLSERGRPVTQSALTSGLATSIDISCPGSPIMHHYHQQQQLSGGGCGTSALLLVLHAGSVLGGFDKLNNLESFFHNQLIKYLYLFCS